VTLSRDLGIAIAGTAAITLAGAWAWKTAGRWRHQSPDEIERLRRLGVNACGRIIPGRIAELAKTVPSGPAGPILLYAYEVGGVTYEAAQDLGALPGIAAAAPPFLPGQTTSVKYDPRQPTNSILACEAWCGIPDLDPNRSVSPEHGEAPAEPPGEKTPVSRANQGRQNFPRFGRWRGPLLPIQVGPHSVAPQASPANLSRPSSYEQLTKRRGRNASCSQKDANVGSSAAGREVATAEEWPQPQLSRLFPRQHGAQAILDFGFPILD
jgi:hypothetical protein